MLNKLLLISLMFLFGGCGRKIEKEIALYFENNSDSDSLITMEVFLNGNIVKSIDVRNKATSFYDTAVKVIAKVDMDKKIDFMFVSKQTNDTSRCSMLSRQQLDTTSSVHVNLVSKMFRKGYVVFDEIVTKDSVVYHDFYCEVLSK